MQIIFGKEQRQLLDEKFTILELDTFAQEGLNSPVTAYAVIGFNDVPLMDIPSIERFNRMHDALMVEYKKKNWDFCLQALEHLKGQWSKQLDSFYEILESRILELSKTALPDDWSPVVMKST